MEIIKHQNSNRIIQFYFKKIAEFNRFDKRHIPLLLIAAFLSCTKAGAAESFRIKINNAEGIINCRSVVGKSNNYKTNVRTVTTATNWGCDNQRECSLGEWTLRYQRPSEYISHGGRCETEDNPIISGNGTFSAEVFVDENVSKSTGVFTIGIISTPFNIKYEVDLIVVNVSEGIAKFGSPFNTKSVKLEEITGEWVNIHLEIINKTCKYSIGYRSKIINDIGFVSCELGKGSNHIVINSRGRAADYDNYASIKVRNVEWIQR